MKGVTEDWVVDEYMGVYGNVWICMKVYWIVWQCMGVYENE